MNQGNSKTRRRAPRRGTRSGFTLVDVVVATFVLVIAIGGLSSAVISTMQLQRANEESAAAYAALREMTESVQATDFGDIFATFNADPGDDPDGAGSAPGENFAVFGLDARPGDADGLVGQIVFPTVPAGGADELREDVVDAAIGMPRDLNGDGAVDGNDHAGDYTLLPVTFRLQWRGSNGDRQLEASVLLVE